MNVEGNLSQLFKEERKLAEDVRLREQEARALVESFEQRNQDLIRKIEVAKATVMDAPCWWKEASWQVEHCQTQFKQEYQRTGEAHYNALEARAKLDIVQESIQEFEKLLRMNPSSLTKIPGNFIAHGQDDIGDSMRSDILLYTSDLTSSPMAVVKKEDTDNVFLNAPVAVQAAVNAARNSLPSPHSLMSYQDFDHGRPVIIMASVTVVNFSYIRAFLN